jgi:hypothetical protein
VKGVDGSFAVGSCANGLLAGADEGVAAVPNMFDGGAVDVVLVVECAFEPEPKPKRLLAGAVAVAVAFSVPCALVPVLNMLFCGVSCWVAFPLCALVPNPLKMLPCAGAALFCAVLKPPNMLLVAGVPAVCALELAPPNVKGVDAAAGMLVGVAAAPNIFVGGALLVMVPNRPPVLAALVVLVCGRPPNGLLGACEDPNMEPPPKAGGAPLPFPFIAAVFVEAKGFALPAVKLKSFADGGWGLKPVLWLLAPKAGKDELEKVLLGAADWAGGKLFVAPPPNGLLLAPNMPLVLLLPPTAGADAPKLKLDGCADPKFALCDGVCVRVLAARCSCWARILRLHAALLYLLDDMPRAAMADAAGGMSWLGGTHGSSSCWAPDFGSLDSRGNKGSASVRDKNPLWRGRARVKSPGTM